MSSSPLQFVNARTQPQPYTGKSFTHAAASRGTRYLPPFANSAQAILTIAGLWDEWTDLETKEPLKSCTMIITEPNKFVAQIHDRMPVLLEPQLFDAWLTGNAGLEILQPAAENKLQRWPVSTRVNSNRADGDDPTLIAPNV